MRKIKLIWDFRGQDAAAIAKHHEIHLKEYLQTQKYELQITGNESFTEMWSIAYMVVNEEDMLKFRDALLPHRAEVYE